MILGTSFNPCYHLRPIEDIHVKRLAWSRNASQRRILSLLIANR